MKKLLASKPAQFLAAVGFTAVGLANNAMAQGFGINDGVDASRPSDTNVPTDLFGATGIFSTIANVLIFLVGAIAVIFLIIGGLRYVISNGDSKNVEAAKNTILYAVIGIIVAILAFALVRFVTGAFTA